MENNKDFPSNLEEALLAEEMEEGENSFYDVFEKHSDEYETKYKIMAGIPIT